MRQLKLHTLSINRFTSYICGWLLWLVALVFVFTDVAGQSMPNTLLAYEVANRSLLHTEPIIIQQPNSNTALAALNVKLPADNAARPLAYSTTDLTNIYVFADNWVSRPVSPLLPVKISSTPIARQYYADNIFDIDDTSNPFSLPRQRKGIAHNAAEKPSVGQKLGAAWAEVMVLDNAARAEGSPMWLTFVIFGLIGMLAMLVSLFPKAVLSAFQAFGSGNSAGQVFREDNRIFSNPSNLLMLGVSSCSMGILVFLAAQLLTPSATFNTFAALSLSILAAASAQLLKFAQIHTAAWLFSYPQPFLFYSFIVSNTNKILGIGLTPLLLFLAFSPSHLQTGILYTTFAALAAVYTFRNFKALSALSDVIRLHKFYFFLYLCTVEIAPWLIILKLLSIL